VANYLRLLKLPPAIQLGLRQRQIGMGHARALIGMQDPAAQLELYRRIMESQLSVRQVEEIARGGKPAGGISASKEKMSGARQKELGRHLSNLFGSKVNVKQAGAGKGRIEIAFRNDDDLERIKRLLESR
jgi:ParB family chromosome partitioning protein